MWIAMEKERWPKTLSVLSHRSLLGSLDHSGQQLLFLLGRAGQPLELPVDGIRVDRRDTAGKLLLTGWVFRVMYAQLDRRRLSADVLTPLKRLCERTSRNDAGMCYCRTALAAPTKSTLSIPGYRLRGYIRRVFSRN